MFTCDYSDSMNMMIILPSTHEFSLVTFSFPSMFFIIFLFILAINIFITFYLITHVFIYILYFPQIITTIDNLHNPHSLTPSLVMASNSNSLILLNN